MRSATYAPGELMRRFRYRDLWVFCKGRQWFKNHDNAMKCAEQLRKAHIAAGVNTLAETRYGVKRICLFVEDCLEYPRSTEANEICALWGQRDSDR